MVNFIKKYWQIISGAVIAAILFFVFGQKWTKTNKSEVKAQVSDLEKENKQLDNKISEIENQKEIIKSEINKTEDQIKKVETEIKNNNPTTTDLDKEVEFLKSKR